MLDVTVMQLLQSLPRDLQTLGWTVNVRESGPSRILRTSWCIAVYERPFDPVIDSARYARPTADGLVRVSTDRCRSATWLDAYWEAIELMRDIDAWRPPTEHPSLDAGIPDALVLSARTDSLPASRSDWDVACGYSALAEITTHRRTR